MSLTLFVYTQLVKIIQMKRIPKLSSLIDKAIFDYNLLENGDKILIGASGGKDSTALCQYFANRLKRPNENFEVLALNIQSDFAPPFPTQINSLFTEWNIPFKTLNVNVLERVKPNQKMSCWWCSTQRRTELLNYAIKNGFNKIALGHHADDILETMLMNMLYKGELSTMTPSFKYENYPITVIRPLCYVSEERLIEHAKQNGYIAWTCTCDYQNNSMRKEAKRLLQGLTGGDIQKKEKMLCALKNVNTKYLL